MQESGTEKTTQPNQSGEKLLKIMEYLADQGQPSRVLDIANALHMNTSTALRFLLTLRSSGYAAQDPETSRYYLTFKICSLAGKVSASADIRNLARPYLMKLSRLFGESSCLAIESDLSVTYIDVVEGPDSMIRSMQRIGNVAPMHCTGIGKLLLLNAGPDKLDQLIAVKGMTKYTKHTLTSKEQLTAELDRVRQRGYAYDDEECEIGARCIAFPIRDYTGQVVAGFSVTGPASRLTDEAIGKRMEELKKASMELSQKMGYEVL